MTVALLFKGPGFFAIHIFLFANLALKGGTLKVESVRGKKDRFQTLVFIISIEQDVLKACQAAL